MRLLALIILTISIPIFIVIAIAIYFKSGSKVIFQQKRVGINKTEFTIYKFRTMEQNKITSFGKLIRKLGLDELPQLLNIMKGDMAFVGPRPLTREDIERLGWNNDGFKKRWDVKPGITGKAQLISICDASLSIQNDIWYVENQSFWVDLNILSKSILVPLIGKRTA
jgi:sugar transferase EpsL